ncbi:MAG: lysylphosphatidylglycerol synthase transmembrane domain-containing protein [Tepidisphaeraceae bacterium]
MIDSTPIPIPTSPAEDRVPDAPPATSTKKRIIALVKLLLTLVVVAYVVRALVAQFRDVEWDQLHVSPGYAALSVLCTLAVSGVQLLVFTSLLRAYGYRLPWRVTLGAAWVPPLGKYVPGKVASIAGAVYLQRKHGVPGSVAVSVALMLDGLAVIAGLVVSTPLLLWEPVRNRMPSAWMACVALCAGGIVALHPRVFSTIVNFLLKKLGRSPLAIVPPFAKYALPVVASFAQWLFAGLGLWLMTRSVTDVSPRDIPLFIATAALAMTVSYLALFAPGGVGVREWLYLITLGPTIGAHAAIVAVAMRVVQTIVELVLATLGFAALRGARTTSSLSHVVGGEGGGEGRSALDVGPRSIEGPIQDGESNGSSTPRAARPSPLPSPRSTGERE